MIKLTDKLPNPFGVNYQHGEEPLDLYTEEQMLKFAEYAINECIQTINDFEIVDRNGTPIEQVVDALCRIRCEIKEKFGME